MKRTGQLQRSQGLKAKRPTKRRTTSPRCTRQRCGRPAKIRGLCLSHAEREADRLFSLWVRERDARCTMSGHGVGRGCGGPLQAAHGEPRGNHAVRYDPRNVHAVCRDHHMLLDAGSKHALKAGWLRYLLGDPGYMALMSAALAPVKKHDAIEEALTWLQAP